MVSEVTVRDFLRLMGLGLVSAAVVVGAVWVDRACASGSEDTLRQLVITPSRTIHLALDLSDQLPEKDREKPKKLKKLKLVASKALKGMVLQARTTKAVHAQNCAIVREGTRVQLEVVDASAPQSGGKPGYVLLKLTQITFADGRMREWDGGLFCGAGVDKTDLGKKFKVLPRKGGSVELPHGEAIELKLIPTGEVPLECTAGEEKEEEDKEEGEEEEGPKNRAITLPASACAKEEPGAASDE